MSFLYKRTNSPYWYYGWVDDAGVQHGISLKVTGRIEAEVAQGIKDRQRNSDGTGSIIKGIPWKQFKIEFLAEYRGNTLEIYKDSFRYFDELARPTIMSDFTYGEAKAFKAKLREHVSKRTKQPLKDNSVNIVLRNMHTAFGEAVKLKYCASNPFEQVKQIPVTKRVPRYLTPDQVRALKQAAMNSPTADTYLMVLFLIHTGVRRQEMLTLKWSAINLERGIIYLHGTEEAEPKDREEHAIGLHPDLIKALKKRPRRSEFVFPGQHGQRDEDSVTRLFNRLYKRAGIAARGCHILRHTFATNFPGNPKVLQRILGHSDPRTTERYQHITPEELLAVRNLNY